MKRPERKNEMEPVLTESVWQIILERPKTLDEDKKTTLSLGKVKSEIRPRHRQSATYLICYVVLTGEIVDKVRYRSE
jgi:hypothetical protein